MWCVVSLGEELVCFSVCIVIISCAASDLLYGCGCGTGRAVGALCPVTCYFEVGVADIKEL